MYNVENKTVMITGAARGLGYKYAEILLRNGAKCIAIVDFSISDGQNAATTLENEFVGKGRAIFYACDVTKAEDLEKTYKNIVNSFEGLDIIINNAGIFNDKLWERTIEVNIKALIHSSFLAMDYMGKHKGGKGGIIVNVASALALYPNGVFGPVYTASKYAVLGFSQILANMYDKTGVRVLIMCPGLTETRFAENMSDRTCDLVHDTLGNINDLIDKITSQSTVHVALAMLDLIQKGKNGAVWVSEGGEPSYAVDFIHYSKRSLPV